MPDIRLRKGERIRKLEDSQTIRDIRQLYKEAAKEASEQIDILKEFGNRDMEIAYYKTTERQLLSIYKRLGDELHPDITKAMFNITSGVYDDMNSWLSKNGFPTNIRFNTVRSDIVYRIATGQIYQKKNGEPWTLSKRIWGINQKIHDDLYRIVASGVAQGKSAIQVAQDLEMYVQPVAQKPSNWNTIYPNVNKKIDYNARRLAVTLMTHAYQQAFEECGRNNPFITQYEWITAGDDRVCPICLDHLANSPYNKDDLPMDHPNGRCSWAYIIPYSGKEIGNRVGNWVNGNYDPELDRYARDIILRNGA